MLYVIVGPPAAGKSTYVREHAVRGDITIDFDAIAGVLTPGDPEQPHNHPGHISQLVKVTRQTVIREALRMTDKCDVWLIHSSPTEALLNDYRKHGARIVVVDPGRATVEERVKAERPWRMMAAVRKWYDEGRAELVAVPTTEPVAREAEQPADEAALPELEGQYGASYGRSTRRFKRLRAEFRAHCRDEVQHDGTVGRPCWLCMRVIDYALAYPHPESFTLDHALTVDARPDLAEDWANFRAAHKVCNEQRGTADPHIRLGELSEQW